MSQHSKWFYSSLYLSIYITPDPSKDERLKRRGLQDMLKEKIEKFPDLYWVIRQWRVTCKGKHSPRKQELCSFGQIVGVLSDAHNVYMIETVSSEL